jgi:KDO2-lipid IV(A) lauroyltransferase
MKENKKSRKRPRSDVVDYLAYLALRLAAMVFHLFPLEMNLRTARWLGRGMWFVIGQDFPLLKKVLRRKHREQIMENLRTAFGDQCSEAELARIARRSCEHLVMFAVECLFTTRLITHGTWQQHVRLKNFEEALRVLLSGHGAVLVTGHYGSWEVLGYTLATLGFDVGAVMRPFDNPYINRYVTEIRARRGLRLLDKKGAAQYMGQVVEGGSALGFIADQDAGHKGLFVDFFGKKASTYKSIALTAWQYHLPVIIGCARRISWERFLYEIEVEDVIYPKDWAGQDNEILYITCRFNRGIEQMVRKDPTQYLWLHRRWKSRPPEETTPDPALSTSTAIP